MTRPDGFTTRDPWTWLHDNEFSWDDVNAIAAILDAGGFDIVRIEALETIFDRLGDVFNLMHPGELTDDEREGIAQGVWFAMHDCKRALGDLEWPRDPEALVIR